MDKSIFTLEARGNYFLEVYKERFLADSGINSILKACKLLFSRINFIFTDTTQFAIDSPLLIRRCNLVQKFCKIICYFRFNFGKHVLRKSESSDFLAFHLTFVPSFDLFNRFISINKLNYE